MKISGTYTIDAPKEQVWEALNDLEVLARIVPGCERLEQVGENEFEGTVKIGIQSIKGTYQGKIRLEDVTPPTHYKLVASGRSSNGVVDGSGSVDLAEQDGKTVLTYGGSANVGGTLASVGQRLIEGAARQLINQSLKALVEQINLRMQPQPVAAPAAPAPATPPAAPAPAEAPAARNGTAPEPPAAKTPPPAPPSAGPSQAQPAAETESFERRAVVVPPHEQLRPEAVISGAVQDFIKERPWIPWAIIAFLIGYLLGRSRR